MCAGESLSRSYSRGFVSRRATRPQLRVMCSWRHTTSPAAADSRRSVLLSPIIGNESVPNITMTQHVFFLKLQSAFRYFQTVTVSECRLIKLLLYILFEKCIDLLPLEMASRGNRRCASCTGTLSFPLSLNSACRLSASLSSFLQSTAQCY